jgi:hypothetical protein
MKENINVNIKTEAGKAVQIKEEINKHKKLLARANHFKETSTDTNSYFAEH